MIRNLPAARRRAARHLLWLAAFAIAGCRMDAGSVSPRLLSRVEVSLEASGLEVGQFGSVTARAVDQFGAPILAGPATFESSAPTVAAVMPSTGRILAIAPGTTKITATIDGKLGELTVTVTKAAIRLNEVQPDGDASTGWVELFNPTAAAVDVSDWRITNANVFQEYHLPAGTTIPAHGYLVIDEASLPSGVGASDQVHVFSRYGVLVDGYFWTDNPASTYGRCADGSGAFVVTAGATRGAANACGQAVSP